MQETDHNVLENSAYSLSTFLFFDKDNLGNEAATELRIKAKLSIKERHKAQVRTWNSSTSNNTS